MILDSGYHSCLWRWTIVFVTEWQQCNCVTLRTRFFYLNSQSSVLGFLLIFQCWRKNTGLLMKYMVDWQRMTKSHKDLISEKSLKNEQGNYCIGEPTMSGLERKWPNKKARKEVWIKLWAFKRKWKQFRIIKWGYRFTIKWNEFSRVLIFRK